MTDVVETNVRTFADNWTGTGTIENADDLERIVLDAGELMTSEIVEMGENEVKIMQNFYRAGDDVTIKYRTGDTIGNCQAADWNPYIGHFPSSGYVQVRLESTQ